MAAQALTNSQPRSALVVDTCALFTLSTPIPNECYGGAGKPKYAFELLDTLGLVARRGMQVVIPEMVALEAAEFFHNGQHLRSIFPESIEKPATALLRRFLQTVRCKPNIRIVPPAAEDESQSALFVRALWGIVSARHCSNARKRHDVIDYRRDHSSRDFGEQAALGWIRQHPGDNVIFLSDDTQALDKARRMGVRILTSADFLHSLCDSGVLKDIGIHAGWPQLRNVLLENEERGCASFFVRDSYYANATNRRNFMATLALPAPAVLRDPVRPIHLPPPHERALTSMAAQAPAVREAMRARA